MKTLIANIALMFVWTASTGNFTAFNLTVGFVLSYAILYFAQPVTGSSGYFGKVPKLLTLVLFFIWELILATLTVAWEIVTPSSKLHPGIVAVPLDANTDLEITLLSNMITLTPGSLALDVSADRSVLYVHTMNVGDPIDFRANIKNGFERRLLEVMR